LLQILVEQLGFVPSVFLCVGGTVAFFLLIWAIWELLFASDTDVGGGDSSLNAFQQPLAKRRVSNSDTDEGYYP
jgi:hypothetical protein